MADTSPPILRPIPRRPHDLNPVPVFEHVSSPPSPLPEDTDPSHPSYSSSLHGGNSGFETPSYLRTTSSINLTSSTLFGIYGNEPDTPSCISSRRESPVPSLRNVPSFGSLGGATLGKEGRVQSPQKTREKDSSLVSSIIQRRGNSPPISVQGIGPWQIIWRIALLFSIGMCYGLMVSQLQNEGEQTIQGGGMYMENILRKARAAESYNWKYLAFWGLAGVGFGGLLPWVDKFWEEIRPELAADGKEKETQTTKVKAKKTPVLAADWNPVVRSIGVFVGIAFAIRKLPWTSTLQVSIALTFINPVLWYLVDGTLSGLIFSSTIGTFGTLFLLLLNPSIVPPPLSLFTSPSSSFQSPGAGTDTATNWSMVAPESILSTGVLDAQTIEIGIWVGSVLFCSAVCFGGIGRRLAIRRTA